MSVKAVPESINFSDEESKTVEYWKEINAFHTSLKQSKNKPRLVTIYNTVLAKSCNFLTKVVSKTLTMYLVKPRYVFMSILLYNFVKLFKA